MWCHQLETVEAPAPTRFGLSDEMRRYQMYRRVCFSSLGCCCCCHARCFQTEKNHTKTQKPVCTLFYSFPLSDGCLSPDRIPFFPPSPNQLLLVRSKLKRSRKRGGGLSWFCCCFILLSVHIYKSRGWFCSRRFLFCYSLEMTTPPPFNRRLGTPSGQF